MEHPDLTFCREALRRASPGRIATETSLFSKRWLEYLRDGHIENPGIQRVSELRDFIKSRPDLFPSDSAPIEKAS